MHSGAQTNQEHTINPFELSEEVRLFNFYTNFHYFRSQDFIQPTALNYSTRYQYRHLTEYYGKNYNEGKKIKKMSQLSVISLNCDFNMQGGRERRMKKEYLNTSEESRAEQLIQIIKQAIRDNVDFISLQQICHQTMRLQLLQAVKQWNQQVQTELQQQGYTDKCQYYYPDNLFKTDTQANCKNFRTTMILTRHQVRFGQLKFYIPESDQQPEVITHLPIQAFCQFQIKIDGEKQFQKVCILSCHLISNGATFLSTSPKQMRRKQIECFQHMSKSYDRFFCIGDTNVPSSVFFLKQNQDILQIFADAITSSRSEKCGTYLYIRDSQEISNERLDRVWMKRENQQSTAVYINYRDEELDQCKGLDMNQRQQFTRVPNKLRYISPTDHTILDITIQFVQ